MGSSIPAPLKLETLSVEIPRGDQLVMSGTLANVATQSELARYLESLHGHIVARHISPYTVNVCGLTFVNSSAIRVFVDWIARAQAAGYKLIFQVDRSITWHRLSFSVLKSLAPSHVEILETGASGAA